MTTLIKANSVRYVAAAPATVISGEDLRADPPSVIERSAGREAMATQSSSASDAERLMLEARLEELSVAYAQAARTSESEAAQAYEKGVSDGIDQGRALAVQDHERNSDALRSGVDAALRTFHESLTAIEPLAVEIAITALERILGDSRTHAELVVRTVAHHLSHIAAGSVVSLEFAQDDFSSNEHAIKAMSSCIADDSVRIGVSPRLTSGQCSIQLNLGSADASLDAQLARVRAVLRDASQLPPS